MQTMRHWEVTLLTIAPANTECLMPKLFLNIVGLCSTTSSALYALGAGVKNIGLT